MNIILQLVIFLIIINVISQNYANYILKQTRFGFVLLKTNL